MKKIFIAALCFIIILSLFGCSKLEATNGNDEEGNNSQSNTTDNDTNNSLQVENTISHGPSNDDKNYEIIANADYLTFEDACEFATDVVVATYIGSRPFGASFTEYRFEVKSRLLGNAADQITVYVMDAEISVEHESVGSYRENELFLYRNTDYLLPLDHRVSVYNDVDIYQFVCNIAIDVSEISNSKMYNQPISLHSEKFDFSKADSASILEYVKQLVKDNTPSAQPEKEPPLADVISSSTDVLVVTVNECTQTVVNDFRNTAFHMCTINEVLKGSMNEGKSIQIIFRSSEVTEGDKIIVALNNYDNATYYRLTTQNSVIPLDEKDLIISYIG